MVARGDLGLEVPLEQLPMLQRRLIEEANFRGVPVIVATQMMHSMITSVRPTRAEVSDIAAAVMGGADAVMLSDETAIGEHPQECVKYLSRIALAAEQSFAFEEYACATPTLQRFLMPSRTPRAQQGSRFRRPRSSRAPRQAHPLDSSRNIGPSSRCTDFRESRLRCDNSPSIGAFVRSRSNLLTLTSTRSTWRCALFRRVSSYQTGHAL
jgi:hypothetical protein